MSEDLPVGTVTFFFTDIEDSTGLWERHPQGMRRGLARHDAILRAAVAGHNGVFIKTTGDGIHAVFNTALEAVSAALAGQQALLAEPWEMTAPDVIRVRMGIHTGEAELREGDYFGPAVNRAARLMSIGHGGQVLLSGVTAGLVSEGLDRELALTELGDVHLRGLNRPEHVYQLLAPEMPSDFPPLRTDTAVRSNLPAQLTSFIGREREQAEVIRLLQESRLLTLTGPGGTGKTRLSLEVAAEVQDNYSHGAWLVELAPLTDPDDVANAVAALWDLHPAASQTTSQALVEYFRGKELLLILDNCEHLVAACARLAADLLSAAPQLTIVASSREGLGAPGETTFHLPTLPLPAEGDADPLSLLNYDSVRLFVERAGSTGADFQLTERNAAAVNHIVRRLDGIPLAIELATTRLRLMPPEQLAERLDDRFRLLTGGSRTALPRQQTLRALIDWSYSLLQPDEQALFRLLSVFSGGWSLAAVEAVADPAAPAGSGQGPETDLADGINLRDVDVIDLLSRLVDKSLVVAEANEGQARFRYLETIRQYARDRLLEEGESAAALNRQLVFITHLVIDPELFEEQGEVATAVIRMPAERFSNWIERLRYERDNIDAAVGWALESDPELALRLAIALSIFTGGWPLKTMQNWLLEAINGVEASAAVENGETAQKRLLLIRGMIALGNLHMDQADFVEALPWFRKAEAEARLLGRKEELAAAVVLLAIIDQLMDQPRAVDEALEAEALFKELGDPINRAFPLFVLAMSAQQQGQKARAEAMQKEALTLIEGTGTMGEWMMYGYLGIIARWEGDLDAASELMTRAAARLGGYGTTSTASDVLTEVAVLKIMQHDLDGAEAIIRQTIQDVNRRGNLVRMAILLESFAEIAVYRDQFERAAALFGAAEALRERIASPMLPYQQGAFDEAVALLQKSMPGDQFEINWGNGRLLTVDAAAELALSRE